MKQTLNNSELSIFSGQLAMILHSGISSLEGISILRDDMPEGEGRKILDTVYDTLEQTGDLAQSFAAAEVYPAYFLKMTKIGERSGTLEEVMDSLSDYYRRQDTLMRSIKEALTYPLILLTMLLAVLIVLMTQVMPVFRQVFNQLGIKMTGISNTVFTISGILQKISIVLLILVVLTAIGCLFSLRSEKGKSVILSAVCHLPLGRTVSNLLACSRFSDSLSLALHSGLDMGESFELAAGLTEQPYFQEKVNTAKELLDQGSDLADSLKESGIITGLNARMVSIGFHTGAAETALKQISVSCQEEADNRIQSAVGALEPTLTAILSILTGLILVSVMLPLLGVMANIG